MGDTNWVPHGFTNPTETGRTKTVNGREYVQFRVTAKTPNWAGKYAQICVWVPKDQLSL